MAPKFRVAAVLPALNESASIVAVVRAIGSYAQPIVVDDGSTDGTGLLAKGAGAEVVTHLRNLGYDYALESGLLRAINLGFDFAITIDADGQHDPTLLQRFIESLENGADFVIGVRDRHQRWSESLFAFVGKYLWKLDDPLCGMKGYRIELLRKSIPLLTYRSVGTELALRAARSQCKVVQVPIATRKRSGESRFGRGLKANLVIFKALLLGCWKR